MDIVVFVCHESCGNKKNIEKTDLLLLEIRQYSAVMSPGKKNCLLVSKSANSVYL